MGYIAYPVASQDKQGGLTLLDETAALKEYNTGNCKRDGQTVYVLTYPLSEYIEVTKSDLEWALCEIEKYESGCKECGLPSYEGSGHDMNCSKHTPCL